MIIKIQNMSKVFTNHDRHQGLKHEIFGLFNKNTQKNHVLKNINLEINKGDFVGLIGNNGTGKTTLLSLIAKILYPTSGSIHVEGTVLPLLGLGVGFNRDLTGKDNLFLYGTAIGLSKRLLKKKFNTIIKDASLEKFINIKLKKYSSGMQFKLAFSITKQANYDIILLDEFFSISDFHYQQKCFDFFNELKKRGKTMVFVTHDLDQISKLCNKCILLKHGKVQYYGDVKTAIKKHEK